MHGDTGCLYKRSCTHFTIENSHGKYKRSEKQAATWEWLKKICVFTKILCIHMLKGEEERALLTRKRRALANMFVLRKLWRCALSNRLHMSQWPFLGGSASMNDPFGIAYICTRRHS